MNFKHVTPAYSVFWETAAERQAIFNRRQRGEPGPWTTDPILRNYKFTNVYRVLDRTTQFIIREVIDNPAFDCDDPHEVFFRVILFKMYNRIETWQYMAERLSMTAHHFKPQEYDAVLAQRLREGHKIFTGSHMTCTPHEPKYDGRAHLYFLELLEKMMRDDLHNTVKNARTQSEVYHAIAAYPLVGRFTAYQWSVDLNYSRLTNFPQGAFTVAGPGAERGLKWMIGAPRPRPEDAIALIVQNQKDEFYQRGIKFEPLNGDMWMTAVDVEHWICETMKYLRARHPELTPLPKQMPRGTFTPRPPIEVVFPKKWGVNYNMQSIVEREQ